MREVTKIFIYVLGQILPEQIPPNFHTFALTQAGSLPDNPVFSNEIYLPTYHPSDWGDGWYFNWQLPGN